MKAYTGSFYKVNGRPREMTYVKLADLSETFLEDHITGGGTPRELQEGMELVWDLESEGFRVFNHSRIIDKPKAVHIEDF